MTLPGGAVQSFGVGDVRPKLSRRRFQIPGELVEKNAARIGVGAARMDGEVSQFAAQQTFSTGAGPQSVVFADINNDGKADAVVTNGDDGTVSVLADSWGWHGDDTGRTVTAIFAAESEEAAC